MFRKIGRRKLVPYYDRGEIEDGAIAGRGLEICWLEEFRRICCSSRSRVRRAFAWRMDRPSASITMRTMVFPIPRWAAS